MKFMKGVGGFVLGSLGAFCSLLVYSYYFGSDYDFFFVLIVMPLGILIGGGAGAIASYRTNWTRTAFHCVGCFALVGAVIVGLLWVFVNGPRIEADEMAVWFNRDRVLSHILYGVSLGGAIGASIGQVLIPVFCGDFIRRRKRETIETGPLEDHIWPPPPTQTL